MDLYTGANIVMNAILKPMNWAYVQQTLLPVDDKFSVYEFIRVATGDPTYTKESIDESKSSSK